MAALTLATTVSASNSNILVATVSASDSFDIQVDGELFASSAPVVVTLAGLEFSKRKGNLVSKTRTNSTGTDLLGSYSEHRTAWTAGTTAFETAVRVYSDAVMYEQHWPEGATNSKGGGGGGSGGKGTSSQGTNTGIIGGYPAFVLPNPDSSSRGFLAFGGRQLETCFAGPLAKPNFNTGDGGGGPLSVYDKRGRTLTMTIASEFMSTSWGAMVPPSQPSPPSPAPAPAPVLAVGTQATMLSLPAGFKVLTLVVAGNGPTASVVDAGSKLLKLYNKNVSEQPSPLLYYYLIYIYFFGGEGNSSWYGRYLHFAGTRYINVLSRM